MHPVQEAFRQAHKAEAKSQGFNLTPLAFIMKAAVAALKEFPQFNASLEAAVTRVDLRTRGRLHTALTTRAGEAPLPELPRGRPADLGLLAPEETDDAAE